MRTVITCHSNADCDALASLVGALLLYPDAELLFPGSQERQVQEFYDGIVEPLFPCVTQKELDPLTVDRLVVVDCHVAGRIPQARKILEKQGLDIHVWDHHPLEEGEKGVLDASLCRIEPVGAASTILCEEIIRRRVPVHCEAATCLMAGIHGDTGSFLYGSATPRDMDAASFLLTKGPDLGAVARVVRRVMGREQLKALSEMLESTEVREINGEAMAISCIHSETFLDDFATLAPRIMEIEDCRVLFAVASMDDKVQVVGRSSTPLFDVGEICRRLGGGGHHYAASASVKDKTVPQVRDFLLMQASFILNAEEAAGTLMTSPAVGVPSGMCISDALALMNRYGLKAVPVFAEGTRVCEGLLSQETAARAVGHGLGGVSSSIYMQPSFQCVCGEAGLQELVDIMIGGRQRLIPVVEGNDLPASERAELSEEERYALLAKRDVIGVVTRTDLIRLFMGDKGVQIPAVSKTKKERSMAPMMKKWLPPQCLELLHLAGDIAADMGISVYVVGGFVRDLVMEVRGRKWPDLDIDLVVEGSAIDFAHNLAIRLRGRVKEHREFMTAMVLFPEESLQSAKIPAGGHFPGGGVEIKVDVASARLEFYDRPGAMPQVERSSIKMDLFRRDFSINAMAVNLNPASFGQLVDYFDGQNDIRGKRVRVLHALSFVEDPTRMFRAVRFEQRYGFRLGGQCEKFMRNAIDDLHLIDSLAGVRIVHELELVVDEKQCCAILSRLDEFGILAAVHPVLALSDEKRDMVDRIGKVLEWYQCMYLPENPDRLMIILIALCRRVPAPDVMAVLERLQFTEKRSRGIMAARSAIMAVRQDMEKWARSNGPISMLHTLLKRAPLEALLYLLSVEDRPEQHEKITRYIYMGRTMRAGITGDDVMALGVERGAAVGRILDAVAAARMDAPDLDREGQLALARRLAEEERSGGAEQGQC